MQLNWQQDKEETKKSRASYMAQLNEQRKENNTLLAALNMAEQQLESHQMKWQEEKSSLIKATEDLKKTLQDQDLEVKKIASNLTKTEDLLETERLHWQQEKISLLQEMEKSRASYVAELDLQKQDNNTLVAALKNFEQELNHHRMEWQEEK